ncbi:MAG: pantetheine-phosphate adenylyltransferase [Candidatus Goldbacteria bacterium]|nr:pantetheine-phosphate adenylyltransferase [Candidatus Goldiibacteriota bacterium]
MKNKVVYPGTFDPITNGHIDIIRRISKMFDEVIVAVAENKHKNPLFSLEERIDMVKNSTKHIKGVKVDYYKGLLVDYLIKVKRFIVIRGLRAFSDFEYEFQLNLINKRLGDNIEMIYMMPDETFIYISSSAIKELAYHNGPIDKFVPPYVVKQLNKKTQNIF